MSASRFDRNVLLFGQQGQDRLRAKRVAVVGVGGLGTHVLQQLALLGVGGLVIIDREELDISNKNRYVGSLHVDPVPGLPKVDLGERLILAIDPTIQVTKIKDTFISEAGFAVLKQADCVFGSMDREGCRLILNEFCAAYERPYFDLATEIVPGEKLVFGGRVCCAIDGGGCISCLGVLDVAEAQRDLSGPSGQQDRKVVYGVKMEALAQAGPSVVSLNGVVASLAVTEFMVWATGLREPKRLLTYYGERGAVTVNRDQPPSDCYYCKGIRGKDSQANLERYIREGIGEFLR